MKLLFPLDSLPISKEKFKITRLERIYDRLILILVSNSYLSTAVQYCVLSSWICDLSFVLHLASNVWLRNDNCCYDKREYIAMVYVYTTLIKSRAYMRPISAKEQCAVIWNKNYVIWLQLRYKFGRYISRNIISRLSRKQRRIVFKS